MLFIIKLFTFNKTNILNKFSYIKKNNKNQYPQNWEGLKTKKEQQPNKKGDFGNLGFEERLILKKQKFNKNKNK